MYVSGTSHSKYTSSQKVNTVCFGRKCLFSQKILKKLDKWIAGGKDRDLDEKFKKWFGYRRGIVATTTATSIVYANGIIPPNVTDFKIAQKVVREYYKHALEVLENLNCERLCFAWGQETGVFVYPFDLNENIHLGLQIFYLTSVNVTNQVNMHEDFNIPTFRRNLNGEVGFVNLFLHEVLHFVIKNSNVTDQSLLSSMLEYEDDSDYKYLNDIHVTYRDKYNAYISFAAYGISECKRLAKNIPSATLCNSDSYAEFFADVMELIRPTMQYRGI